MTDYKAEQADEVEALESIYMEQFEIVNQDPTTIQLKLEPGCDSGEEQCFVGLYLRCTYPETYPDELPIIELQSIKGLEDSQLDELKEKLLEEANASLGIAMVFTLAEVAKEWLESNNVDRDESMHEQMLARMSTAKAEEEAKQKLDAGDDEEEEEELDDVTKARMLDNGIPVTQESFAKWLEVYRAETEGTVVTEVKPTGRELFENNKVQVEFEDSEEVGALREDLFVEGEDDLDDLDDLDSD